MKLELRECSKVEERWWLYLNEERTTALLDVPIGHMSRPHPKEYAATIDGSRELHYEFRQKCNSLEEAQTWFFALYLAGELNED